VSELKQRYTTEVIPALKSEFGYTNAMQVPRLEKIVVNIGLGEALTNAKAVDAAVGDLALITGQRAIVTKAKKTFWQQHGVKIAAIAGAVVILGGLGGSFLYTRVKNEGETLDTSTAKGLAAVNADTKEQ
jgi:ribosomal protein L5